MFLEYINFAEMYNKELIPKPHLNQFSFYKSKIKGKIGELREEFPK